MSDDEDALMVLFLLTTVFWLGVVLVLLWLEV